MVGTNMFTLNRQIGWWPRGLARRLEKPGKRLRIAVPKDSRVFLSADGTVVWNSL